MIQTNSFFLCLPGLPYLPELPTSPPFHISFSLFFFFFFLSRTHADTGCRLQKASPASLVLPLADLLAPCAAGIVWCMAPDNKTHSPVSASLNSADAAAENSLPTAALWPLPLEESWSRKQESLDAFCSVFLIAVWCSMWRVPESNLFHSVKHIRVFIQRMQNIFVIIRSSSVQDAVSKIWVKISFLF